MLPDLKKAAWEKLPHDISSSVFIEAGEAKENMATENLIVAQLLTLFLREVLPLTSWFSALVSSKVNKEKKTHWQIITASTHSHAYMKSTVSMYWEICAARKAEECSALKK